MVITTRSFLIDLAARKHPFQGVRRWQAQPLRILIEAVWNLLRGRVKLLPREAAYIKQHRQKLLAISSCRDAASARRQLSLHAKDLLPPLLPALAAHFQR